MAATAAVSTHPTGMHSCFLMQAIRSMATNESDHMNTCVLTQTSIVKQFFDAVADIQCERALSVCNRQIYKPLTLIIASTVPTLAGAAVSRMVTTVTATFTLMA